MTISAERKGSAEPAARDARLEAALATVPGAAVFVVDRDLRYQLAAGEGLRDASLETEQLVGRTIFEVLEPSVASHHEPHYRAALAGEPFTVEHEEHGRAYVTRGTPLRNAAGEVTGALAVSYDITDRKRAEEALRESEERYRTLFESIDEGLCVLEVVEDEHGSFVDLVFREASTSFGRQTGLTDLVGRTVQEVLPTFAGYWRDTCAHVLETGEHVREENYVADVARWYRVYYSRVGGEGSRLVALVFDDITGRKRTESLLRHSEDRYAFLLKLSDVLRAESDAATIGVVATRLIAEQLGVDRCWIAHVRRDDGLASAGPEYRRGDLQPLAGEYRLSEFPDALGSLDAEPLVVDDVDADPDLSESDRAALRALEVAGLAAVPRRNEERDVVWVFAIASVARRSWTREEVTLLAESADRTWSAIERVRNERAARLAEEARARQQNRFAGEQLERSRWARELHDETLQGLAAIQVQLVAALQSAGFRRELLESASELVGTEITNLRSIIRELRPPALEELGLDGAVASLVADLDAREGAAVRLQLAGDGHGAVLSADTELGIFRVVQEALANAAEHAGASSIEVEITRSATRVEAVVRDDGTGFDADASTSGYGLAGMRERAELAGGVLELTSHPGTGTTVRVSVPLS